MKVVKEIAVCVTPFMVTATMLYPFFAILGASTDPFVWDRADRGFYFICTIVFGFMLLTRVQYAREE